MHKYTGFYCPQCTAPLDARGDHWPGCEYEAEYADENHQPLNEQQMLERRLERTSSDLKRFNSVVRCLRKERAEYSERLAEIQQK